MLIFFPKRGSKVLFKKKTLYNDIAVFDDGEKIKMTLDSSGNLHSIYIKGKVTTGSYWDICACALWIHPNPKDVVILGVGGGTIARIISAFTDAKIIGVDIDIWTIKAGMEFLKFPKTVHCVVDRYESFVDWVRCKFDFAVVDVFSNASLPSSIFSKELSVKLSKLADVICVNTTSQNWANQIFENLLPNYLWGVVIKNYESSNWIVLCSKKEPFLIPKIKEIKNPEDAENLKSALELINYNISKNIVMNLH